MNAKTRFAVPVALFATFALALAVGGGSSSAQDTQPEPDCQGLPSHTELRDTLRLVVEESGNGGLSNDMWATVVNRDGVVCAVAFSSRERDRQWPGSRIISAQKAHTANAFSLPPGAGGLLPGLALSTANLFTAVQPGGSLFGLQHSNPVDPRAYDGDHTLAGQPNDPLVGQKIGGVNVFGGGLGLYNQNTIVGGIGVSGDTSCTDHIVSWKTRFGVNLDHVRNGLNPPTQGDNIIHDSVGGPQTGDHYTSPSGFGHPQCDPVATAVANLLPVTHPLGSGTQPSESEMQDLLDDVPDAELPIPGLEAGGES